MHDVICRMTIKTMRAAEAGADLSKGYPVMYACVKQTALPELESPPPEPFPPAKTHHMLSGVHVETDMKAADARTP